MFPRAVRHGLLIAAAVVWLAPVIVLALVAVRDISDFARYGALALPHTLRWANFTDAWNLGVSTYLFNSLLMTAIKVPTGVLVESLAAFALVLAATRYVSLGSMVAAVTLPVSAWLLGRANLIIGVSVAVAVFVLLRHRANISRLLAGTESKIGRKPTGSQP